MTRPGIEPRSPGPLANTLTARPRSRLIGHTITITSWFGITSVQYGLIDQL